MTKQATAPETEFVGAELPEHDLFKPFVGRFRAEVKMWMGPGEPTTTTGTMVNTLDLGGRFLRQEYKGDEADGFFANFEGRGYWGYNQVMKRFEGFWIDSAANFFQLEYGAVDKSGKRWEMKGEIPAPEKGKKTLKRTVIELQDNKRHSMTMFMTGPDGKENKVMEIAYTRA